MTVWRCGFPCSCKAENNGNGAVRQYQNWKGSNRFFCNGRIMLGPDVNSCVCTFLLISIPAILFMIFTGPALLPESPYVLVVFVIMYLWTVSVFWATACTDPGIIPRMPTPEGLETPRIVKQQEVVFNGHVVKLKFCETCNIFRPPRCSHCSICNNCVDRFDHHCPWVGNCIGKRNYRFFLSFVFSATILIIFTGFFASYDLYLNAQHSDDSGFRAVLHAISSTPVSMLIDVFCFIFVWFVGGLSGFHIFLVVTNQTTNEQLKGTFTGKSNPYSHGCTTNFASLLCTTMESSLIDVSSGGEKNEEEEIEGTMLSTFERQNAVDHSIVSAEDRV